MLLKQIHKIIRHKNKSLKKPADFSTGFFCIKYYFNYSPTTSKEKSTTLSAPKLI